MARRQGRTLQEEGVVVLPVGGATSIGTFVRALGAPGIGLRLVGALRPRRGVASPARSYRRFQAQPAQRERPEHAQLRRFLGTRSGRKIRYGSPLVEALELDRVPQPLGHVLDPSQC